MVVLSTLPSFSVSLFNDLQCLSILLCSVRTQGLRSEGFIIDGEKYWEAVRRGTKESLKPDKEVKNALASLTQPHKFVFTNGAEKASSA